MAATLLAAGCSSAADDSAVGVGIDGAESYGPGNEDPFGSGDGDADDDTSTTGPADPGADDGGSSGENDDSGAPRPPPPGMDDGTFAGCPEPLPGAWVFCEDFETVLDPGDVVLDYQDGDGAFVLVDELGASGTHSMEVAYREGEEGAGWMVLSFGASPIDAGGQPTYAPEGSFQEIYWRMRVKTEPGWPDMGPGQLTRTISFADSDWTEAVVARLYAAQDEVTVTGQAATCVTGAEIACSGFNDTAGLEPLSPVGGAAPLFSSEMSGQWHCVEGRLRLNTPGQPDGEFEFWVDEQPQGSRTDLDLRGSWSDYGINGLVVENLWPGGAPAPLRRWMDDLVVSTEPIGCSPDPAGATPN